MKKLIYLLLLAVLFVSCNKDEILTSADRNVISEDPSNPFEELIVLLNVKTSDSSYLVVKSIDSVTIFVNNLFWTKMNTDTIDTSYINKFVVGNMYQTRNKLNYLIVANQTIDQPDYSTAGDYARYLNALYELKPGEYACLIESFQITFNDNTTRKYQPNEYRIFKVVENSRSVFVGEIELNID